MTVARGLLILAMLASLAVAIVLIRTQSARAANRVQRLHRDQIQIEQKLWSEEMKLAKLRVPEEIRRRTDEWGLGVVPPTEGGNPDEADLNVETGAWNEIR